MSAFVNKFFFGHSNIQQGLLAEAQWGVYWKDTLLHFLETKQQANHQCSIRRKGGTALGSGATRRGRPPPGEAALLGTPRHPLPGPTRRSRFSERTQSPVQVPHPRPPPSQHHHGVDSGAQKFEKLDLQWASQVSPAVKDPPADTGDAALGSKILGSISGWGRCPGGRHGSPLQYACPENPMDRGAWRATIHGVTESDTTEVT